jgi:hypothetical protein
MNGLMQTIALVEMSLTCAVIFTLIAQKIALKEFSLALKVLLLVLLSNLFFWPLGWFMELPLAAYVRGFTGDLSIVSMLLLWSVLLPSSKSAPIIFKVSLAVIALAFYPFALGLGMIDPYAWGYGAIPFYIGVLAFAVICGLANWNKGVWIIALAIIAWSVHWHESANLWDYLLDPFLALWSIIALVTVIYRQRRDKARSGYLFRPG